MSDENIKEEVPVPVKKSVGFAPMPEEDLWEHHKDVKKKEEERMKANPFHKIPPELSHLEKKPVAPKPLPVFEEHKPTVGFGSKKKKELGDLRNQAIKDISIQNKGTELNFHYPTIRLPMQPGDVLVDIKYASLNSFDLSKINQYLLNVSNVKVGLGYEFAGEVISVGSSFEASKEFSVGDKVVGIVNPIDKKGSLSSSQVINPRRDVLITVDDVTLEKLSNIDVQLSFEKPDENERFEVESDSTSTEVENPDENKINPNKLDLPPLAKLASFPLQYCRAKQVLAHSNFKSTQSANILINGADTNLGLTLVQLLNSSLYSNILKKLNMILIVRESSLEYMNNFIKRFTSGPLYNPSIEKAFHIITFDSANEDIVLPGEKVPINYKKPNFFASEVLNALVSSSAPDKSINEKNINNYKLDTLIDIVGSKKFFQSSSTKIKLLDSLNLPIHLKISESCSISSLFRASVKEPFLVKILKPKSQKSSFVSCCDFSRSVPTYEIDHAISHSNNSIAWSYKWSSDVMNSSLLSKYNYYEELYLKIKKEWLLEGLNLLLEDNLQFRIDNFVDWRNNFKSHIKTLKSEDRKLIFEVESF